MVRGAVKRHPFPQPCRMSCRIWPYPKVVCRSFHSTPWESSFPARVPQGRTSLIALVTSCEGYIVIRLSGLPWRAGHRHPRHIIYVLKLDVEREGSDASSALT